MRRFTDLYLALDRTTRTTAKVAALAAYFRDAPPADAAWALAFLTGRRFRRRISWRTLRQWAADEAQLPDWLLGECHAAVGDLSETIALVLPEPRAPTDISLERLVRKRIEPLATTTEFEAEHIIRTTWRELSADERFVFHKLLSGNFRVGVAATLVTRGLAQAAGLDPAVMAHRLAGDWQPSAEQFALLTAPEDPADRLHRPYPFHLASPLTSPPQEQLGDIRDWLLEWKWDGLRAQIIQRDGEVMLWSRGEERMNDSFPELVDAAARLPPGTVLDGEIVAWEAGRPLPFNLLQRRIGRKQVDLMLFNDVPIAFVVFDVLERDGEDLRNQPLSARRAALEAIIAELNDPHLLVSPEIFKDSWENLAGLRERSREHSAEGVMIKQRESPYEVGRKRGSWWKWKVDPFTVDAVLIIAQLGTGKRASLFTDYTFGVWDDSDNEERDDGVDRDRDSRSGGDSVGDSGGDRESKGLIPVAKAYSGLDDEEIREVDRFIRTHTLERKGPVRIVEPRLVFEIAFENIQESKRHRSGIALRFPRMSRWRRDKSPRDADTLSSLRELLTV